MSEDYMCPFCVKPWKCNGPHIEPEDMANFNDYVNEWCEQMRTACLAAVNELTYKKVLKATASPKTARAQVYTLHALARASMLEVQP